MRTEPRDPQRTRMILLAVGGSALVLIAAVAGFLLLSGGDGNGNQGTIDTLRAAGWTYENPPAQGRTHVAALPKSYKANSTPRTSGPHHPNTIIYGFYSEPVPELNAVHNLEHGAVIIWVGPQVPQSTLLQIHEFYTDDPNGLIVAEHPRLGDDIALVAWTHIARGPRWDPEAARAFIDAFQGKGPEPFKIEDLEPGGA